MVNIEFDYDYVKYIGDLNKYKLLSPSTCNNILGEAVISGFLTTDVFKSIWDIVCPNISVVNEYTLHNDVAGTQTPFTMPEQYRVLICLLYLCISKEADSVVVYDCFISEPLWNGIQRLPRGTVVITFSRENNPLDLDCPKAPIKLFGELWKADKGAWEVYMDYLQDIYYKPCKNVLLADLRRVAAYIQYDKEDVIPLQFTHRGYAVTVVTYKGLPTLRDKYHEYYFVAGGVLHRELSSKSPTVSDMLDDIIISENIPNSTHVILHNQASGKIPSLMYSKDECHVFIHKAAKVIILYDADNVPSYGANDFIAACENTDFEAGNNSIGINTYDVSPGPFLTKVYDIKE